MCGRYVPPEIGDMERYWNLSNHRSNSALIRRFNVPPSSQVPVIVHGVDEKSRFFLLDARWGLIPHWWKQDKLPPMTFNARSEEAATKPMWRDALRSTRCIMPAYGWYEWNEKEQVTGPSGKPANQPHYHYSPNSPQIAIAGLWALYRRPDAEPMMSCALMTKEAAPSVAPVHHRMPIILRPEQYDAWLDPNTSANDVQDIIADPRQDFDYYRVSTAVNNARNDYPELLDRLIA